MIVAQYEKTVYPYTPQGKRMADYMEQKLKNQGVFKSRKEGTEFITIEAEYRFIIQDES